MTIFKKKIYFAQFLADLITFQCDFLENKFGNLIVLADEFKVLTEKDKEDFFDKAHELVIVDILMSCNQLFYKTLSSEKIGENVSVAYGKYLTEYKKLSNILASEKVGKVMKLLDLVCKAEEEAQKRDEQCEMIGYESCPKINGDIDKQKFYLCQGFGSYCAGSDIKVENWQGRNFAAFKLAKALVKADIVKIMLKKFKIIWD